MMMKKGRLKRERGVRFSIYCKCCYTIDDAFMYVNGFNTHQSIHINYANRELNLNGFWYEILGRRHKLLPFIAMNA